MRVKEKMTRNPVLLKPQLSVASARELMIIHEYECLYIVDKDDKPIGLVTTLQTTSEKNKAVDKVMKTDFQVLREDQSIQDAATAFLASDKSVLAMPVVDAEDRLVGIIRVKDLVADLSAAPRKEGALTPEAAVIYLSMTRHEDKERLWLDRIKEHDLKPAVTQVGANAEKLPIKLRESAIVAAIAFGVIREDVHEKTAVSNAIRDIILQLRMISPGLGGGFKVGIVRGDGRVSVAAYGRCGHALANSPEQLFMGTSTL